VDRPFFSIIIATYNSERTLEYTLQSIHNQSIDKSEIEIMVVDGGSSDRTKEIADKYGAVILDNPKRLPEYAKAIGVRHANGHYVIRMDSDEEFSYKTQLQDKMEFLKKHKEVKMLMANKCEQGRKDICGISAEYMNILGDPFSYFVYKTKEDKYETYKSNIISEDGKFAVMKFERGDVYPLTDSGTSALSLDYMKEQYPEKYDTIEFTCGAYDQVLYDTKLCGCIKGDNIRHNCSSSFKIYLSKLKFRVINNIFYKQESGFSLKEELSNRLKIRKILFCIYALIIPIPILDSIRLAILYKNLTFLLHFVYLYYVCIQIVIMLVAKVVGVQVHNKIYGK
jgi:glycosyltransferase involved in cell wall biosynthesis